MSAYSKQWTPNDSIWVTSVQSGFLRRIVGLSLLLGLCSAGYIVSVEFYPNSSRASSTVEDQRPIVVSGDVDQQRDAVLANFANTATNCEDARTSVTTRAGMIQTPRRPF